MASEKRNEDFRKMAITTIATKVNNAEEGIEPSSVRGLARGRQSKRPRQIVRESVNMKTHNKVFDTHNEDDMDVDKAMFDEREDDSEFITKTDQNDLFLTLEEIISKGKAKLEKEDELKQVLSTNISVAPRMTPISCIRFLSERGYKSFIEKSFEILKFGTEKPKKLTDIRAHRWRCEYKWGQLLAIGGGPRLAMAKQVAAFQLVELLREKFPNKYIPKCEIPEGTLINPHIFRLLEDQVAGNNDPPPEYSFEKKKEGAELLWICRILVGTTNPMIVEGISYNQEYARRFAAKIAYEELTEIEFELDKPILGSDCYDEKEFQIREAAQIIPITCRKLKRLPVKMGISESGKLKPYCIPEQTNKELLKLRKWQIQRNIIKQKIEQNEPYEGLIPIYKTKPR